MITSADSFDRTGSILAITAADFFTVEVLTLVGLVRYHVLFVIDVASRRVQIAGISCCPDGAWMEQMARNLLDAVAHEL